ncbi:MAG: hypothetical protein JSU60_02810 [Nitrospirota bacterium]|nr:MAG: hypothetical protein JSU60_02810 [Nitrospirota bacterium]
MTTTKLWDVTWFLIWALLMFNALTCSFLYRVEITAWIEHVGIHVVGGGIMALSLITAVMAITETNR